MVQKVHKDRGCFGCCIRGCTVNSGASQGRRGGCGRWQLRPQLTGYLTLRSSNCAKPRSWLMSDRNSKYSVSAPQPGLAGEIVAKITARSSKLNRSAPVASPVMRMYSALASSSFMYARCIRACKKACL